MYIKNCLLSFFTITTQSGQIEFIFDIGCKGEYEFKTSVSGQLRATPAVRPVTFHNSLAGV